MPSARIAASCTGSSLQLSFMIVTNPPGPCSSSTGSASALGTPNWVKEGPMARRSTCFGALPVMMNPPIPALSPVCTSMRVERLMACAADAGVGVAVGVAVGVGVGVAVGVVVGVGLDSGVFVAVAVGVAVAVAVGVGDDVGVGATVAVAVAVG